MSAKSKNTHWLQKHKTLRRIYQQIYYGICKRHIYALTGPLRVLPDFVVIGVVRGGTTSLYQYLGEHPCVVRSAYDELGFFDSNFELGLNWYRSLFPTVFTKNRIKSRQKQFMTFDVTPFYIYNPKVAQRILKTLPKAKLIAILRNPIDRAYSNYHLGVRQGNERRSFEEIINEDIKMLENARSRVSETEYYQSVVEESYLARGFYAEQLKIWMKLFPKEQLLVISTEDLAKNPHKTLGDIFAFLNLPIYEVKNLGKKNEAKYHSMNPGTRKFLIDYFKPYNIELYNLLGKEFEWDR